MLVFYASKRLFYFCAMPTAKLGVFGSFHSHHRQCLWSAGRFSTVCRFWFGAVWRLGLVSFSACNAAHWVRSFWLIPFASPSEFTGGKQVQSFFPSCNARIGSRVSLWGKKTQVLSNVGHLVSEYVSGVRVNNVGQKCASSQFGRNS